MFTKKKGNLAFIVKYIARYVKSCGNPCNIYVCNTYTYLIISVDLFQSNSSQCLTASTIRMSSNLCDALLHVYSLFIWLLQYRVKLRLHVTVQYQISALVRLTHDCGVNRRRFCLATAIAYRFLQNDHL